MEKRKPHYSLTRLLALLRDEQTRHITRKCRQEAAKLGYFSDEMIVERVLRLTRQDFFKSMTAYGNATLWQDVYKAQDDDDPDPLYIKLQLAVDGKGVVIQFKRNTDGEF